MHSNFELTILRSLITLIFGGRKLVAKRAAKGCSCKKWMLPFLSTLLLSLSFSSAFSQKVEATGKVLLEGPYDDGASKMIASLKLDSLVANGLIPEAPTTLIVPSIATHGYNAVDAVRLILRKATFEKIDSIYAWVAEDGTLYDIYTGTSKRIAFQNASEGSYYIGVQHRNHLPVMYISIAAFKYNLPVNFDFTKLSNLYGAGAIMVNSTTCAMIAGNAVSDRLGEVNASDLYAVSKDSDNLKEGYLPTDVDLNGVVNALDRQLTLEHNLKLYHSKVPK